MFGNPQEWEAYMFGKSTPPPPVPPPPVPRSGSQKAAEEGIVRIHHKMSSLRLRKASLFLSPLVQGRRWFWFLFTFLLNSAVGFLQ
jgi:hypothetical protein